MGENSRVPVADGSGMPSNSQNTAPELPGFYFDAERNRYFRVRPGMNNHNPLTMSDITRRTTDELLEIEERAKKKKLEDNKPKNAAIFLKGRSLGIIKTPSFKKEFLAWHLKCCKNIIQKDDVYISPTGISPSKDYKRYFVFSQTRMPHNGYTNPFPGYMYMHEYSGTCCHIETDMDKCLFSSRYKKLVLYSPRRFVELFCNSFFCCASAITKDCKYTASFGDGSSAVLISNFETLFSSRNRSRPNHDDEQQEPIRSFHPRGGPGLTTVRLDQDVFAQAFSYDPNLHFNGLRSGAIVTLDIRKDRRNCKVSRMRQPTRGNVKQIQPLKDGVSLIVGYKTPCAKPSIYLWDIRFTKKPVLQYDTQLVREGHSVRSSVEPRFLINIDAEEQIMTSVLPDYHARFWHIPTGELIKIYPDLGDITEKKATLSMCNYDMASTPKGSFAMVGYHDGSVDYFAI